VLISEYGDHDDRHPVFTVADGIVWLSQVTDRNSVVRKLQVVKVRGQAFMPGLHTVRITGAGLEVFPRIPEQQANRRPPAARRLATGVPGLDELMGGGIPAGDAVLLTGPTGTGKTTFATQFVAAGAAAGEAAVVVVFEEYPERYIARAAALGLDPQAMVDAGTLRVIYLRPLDLSVDETLAEILAAVAAVGATRVVIDSVSGFEIALAPAFREDFRESFYRLVGALTAVGATVLMTTEVAAAGPGGDPGFTGERVSFLTDDIVAQRYVELGGALRTVLAVVKMRGSAHSREFRAYTLTAQGGGGRGAAAGVHGHPQRRPGAARRGGRRRPRRPLGPRGARGGPRRRCSRPSCGWGVGSAEALGTRTGIPAADVEQALVRLVALGYAAAAGEGDGGAAAYRAVARAGGS
jgi:circadian clock protein KaiC